MVLDPDRDQRRGPQRGDRDRPGIVRVVLVGSARAQQPDPRRECRRNVDDVFTRGEELLRQQIAEPTRGLDRPDPRRAIECVCPCDQLERLARTCVHQQLRQHRFVVVDCDRRVRPLVRIDTDHHHRDPPFRSTAEGPRWALLIRDVELLTSFEPHRGRTQQPRNSYSKANPNASDRQFESNDRWTPPTLRTTPQRHRRLNQADLSGSDERSFSGLAFELISQRRPPSRPPMIVVRSISASGPSRHSVPSRGSPVHLATLPAPFPSLVD